MKNHDLPCSNNEENDPAVAIHIVFRPDSEETLRQEVALLMSVMDEVIADMKLLAETEAAAKESTNKSSPS